jgi:putative nucleotidyltransferase with HDIG domain
VTDSAGVSLMRFLLGLSEALDLASPALARHQMRTALLAWRIAESLGLEADSVRDIVIAALLHDIGALSPEDKVSIHGGSYEGDLDLHCRVGALLLSGSAVLQGVAATVREHHTPCRELPSATTPQATASQVVLLADDVERALDRGTYILHQNQDSQARARAFLGGGHVRDDVTEAFCAVAAQEGMWLDLVSPHLHDILLGAPGHEQTVSAQELLSLAQLVRQVVDYRSHFTATHTAGVATAAAELGRLCDVGQDGVAGLEVAGLLHDIGKMAVPNKVLEKPARLTRRELAVMRQHTYHTTGILRRQGLPATTVAWAGQHHERLDGSGYPFHFGAPDLDTGARVMAVADVTTALAEDRPYRGGMTREQVLGVLGAKVRAGHLDGDVVEAVRTRYDEVVGPAMVAQDQARRDYHARITRIAGEAA